MRKYFTSDIIYIDQITLKVKDIKVSLKFYVDNLGFELLDNIDNVYYLGVDSNVLLTLVHDSNAIAKTKTTGLYHFAILLPDNRYLGQLINHFIKINIPIMGGSDHGVSEALYLNDPDGNGIEIYADKEDFTWEYNDNEVVMTNEELDYYGLIQRGYPAKWERLPKGTILGHLHFHVATLSEAAHFYLDVIGFNQMLTDGNSVLFASSDSYHHHLGMNTWAGVNAPNRPNEMVGLMSYHLNTGKKRVDLIRRIKANDIEMFSEDGFNYIIDINNVKVFF